MQNRAIGLRRIQLWTTQSPIFVLPFELSPLLFQLRHLTRHLRWPGFCLYQAATATLPYHASPKTNFQGFSRPLKRGDLSPYHTIPCQISICLSGVRHIWKSPGRLLDPLPTYLLQKYTPMQIIYEKTNRRHFLFSYFFHTKRWWQCRGST